MFAAIREKLSCRNRRPKTQGPRRLGIEALEERALLSTSPVLFATIKEGTGDFGNTTATAKVAQLAPVMETQVQGKLSSGADVDLFKINLQPGQIFTADADTAVFATSRLGTTSGYAKLSLLDSAGNVVATNTAAAGRSLEYRVPQRGPVNATYYVKVTDSTPATADAANYTLHLRPIGLADAGDASRLDSTNGGLYAFLDGSSYSDGSQVLDISGPVGHGFGIRANWTQSLSSVNGLPAATYTTDGILTQSGIRVVYLETPNGEVELPVPDTITVSTRPQLWGDSFGEVASLNWTAPPSLGNYEAMLGALYPAALLDIAAVQEGTKINVGLGADTIVQNTGAPVNAAVPYLYFTANPLMGNPTAGGVSNAFSVVLDPADPFLYIGSKAAGAAGLPINGLAASAHGLIPYSPVEDHTPSQYDGNMSRGHVYVDATINTTALTLVPSEIDGTLVLNVDPNHTGQIFGGVFSPEQLVSFLINPAVAGSANAMTLDPAAAHTLFTNLSVGINGELNIAPYDTFKDGYVPDAVNRLAGKSSLVQYLLGREVPRVLTVADASLIYDGPTESAYFRGGTVNPFGDTPLAKFASAASSGGQTTIDFDAAIKPGGAFYVDAKGTYTTLGLTADGEIKLQNNWPTTTFVPTRTSTGFLTLTPQTVYVTGATADFDVNVLTVNAHLHGQVQGNGDFDLTGSVDAITFAGTSGSADFDLAYTARSGFSFTSDLHAKYENPTHTLRATLDVHFAIGIDSAGRLTYAKDGRVGFASTASVQVYAPNHGWQVWDWEWQTVGTVGVGISNTDIWFSVDAFGTHYAIDIPI